MLEGDSGDVDADAPWRRGFDGWGDLDENSERAERPAPRGAEPAETPDPTSADRGEGHAPVARRSPTSRIALVVGVVVLVMVVVMVVALVVVVPLRRGNDSAELGAAPLIPDGADRQWSWSLELPVDDLTVDADQLTISSGGVITALHLDTGLLRWSMVTEVDHLGARIDSLASVGDSLVGQGADVGSIIAFERTSGRELWRDDGDTSYGIIDSDGDPAVVRRRRVDGVNVVEVVDPGNGQSTSEILPSSGVTAVGRNLGVEPADRRVSLLSLDRGTTVAGPVDSFDLRSVADLGGRVVAFDLDGRIAAYDEDGLRTDEELVAPSTSGASSDLVGVAPPVAIVSGSTSYGFEVDDGDLVLRWERAGRATPPVTTERGAVFLLVDPATRTESIIDAVDGTTIATPETGRERAPMIGFNGYVLAPVSDAANRSLDAFDFDGRPRWSLPIGRDATYTLFDDAIVVVEPTVDDGNVGSVVTVFR